MLTGLALATTLSLPATASMSFLERQAIVSHHQLQLHQGFAVATLGLMALNSGIGLYDVYLAPPGQLASLHTIHVALGGATTALYLSAAALALTAPVSYQATGEPGWDSITVHDGLAWLHAGALAATVLLGGLTALGELDPVYHGLAGGATLALMAASAGVIAFDF